MSVSAFLDTNILAYAAANDMASRPKRLVAWEILSGTDFAISAQVLQELYVTLTRKGALQVSPAEASEWLKRLEGFVCAPIDTGLVRAAITISVRYQISYWDAAIVAAAETLGAPVLYTEDLNHGQAYGRVRVWNPFLGSIRPETGLQ